jgi:hypothetical protein
MSARYVRIPFGSRLEFPPECPFTGAKNPRYLVLVTRSEKQMWLPIPFIGWFSLGKTGQMRFPASAIVAWGNNFLTILYWLLLVGGFAVGILKKDDSNSGYYMLGGVAGAVIVRMSKWFWLHRVRIVRIGMSSLEVRFASERYAKDFSRLNDFSCRDHPAQKRMTPITVNDVR